MTGNEIFAELNRCMGEKRVCSVRNRRETDERFLLPLRLSDHFYLSAIEEGMGFDGFLFDRTSAVERVVPSGDRALAMLRETGLAERLTVPAVDITGPDRFFAWLVSAGIAVLAEAVRADGMQTDFYTGVVTDVSPEGIRMRCFTPACVWEPFVRSFPYDGIARVTFGTRALNAYSAVLPDLPKGR